MKDDDGKYRQALEQAEAVLKKLSLEDWEAMDRFQDMVMEQEAKNSSYLYVCGLKDGIRFMKFINGLYYGEKQAPSLETGDGAFSVSPFYNFYNCGIFLVCAILPWKCSSSQFHFPCVFLTGSLLTAFISRVET